MDPPLIVYFTLVRITDEQSTRPCRLLISRGLIWCISCVLVCAWPPTCDWSAVGPWVIRAPARPPCALPCVLGSDVLRVGAGRVAWSCACHVSSTAGWCGGCQQGQVYAPAPTLLPLCYDTSLRSRPLGRGSFLLVGRRPRRYLRSKCAALSRFRRIGMDRRWDYGLSGSATYCLLYTCTHH